MARRTYEIGNTLVGVRTTSERFAAWMDDVIGGRRARKRLEPYLSVVVAESEPGQVGRPLHVVYAGETAMVRTLDLSLAARTLLAELESFSFEDRRDALHLEGGLVFAGGRTALVPPLAVPYLATLGRAVPKAGVAFGVTRSVAIDFETGRAVPTAGPLEPPAGALEALDGHVTGRARGAERETERRAVEGPLDVDVVCTVGPGEGSFEALGPSEALFALTARTRNLHQTGQTGLDGLVRLVERARCIEIGSSTPREMLTALTSVLAAT